jgi:hypothetical protein
MRFESFQRGNILPAAQWWDAFLVSRMHCCQSRGGDWGPAGVPVEVDSRYSPANQPAELASLCRCNSSCFSQTGEFAMSSFR